MANIICDLDDTLMTTAPLMVAALNSLTGQSHNHQTLYSYDLPNVYTLPSDVIQDRFVEQQVLERAQWTGDQKLWNAAVWNWAVQDHRVIYCTARGWHPGAWQETMKHLCAVGETPCDLVIVNHGEDKTEALLRQGIKPHVFLDDSYDHMMSAHKAGARSILFGQSWNHLKIWGNRVLNQHEAIQAIDAALAARMG